MVRYRARALSTSKRRGVLVLPFIAVSGIGRHSNSSRTASKVVSVLARHRPLAVDLGLKCLHAEAGHHGSVLVVRRLGHGAEHAEHAVAHELIEHAAVLEHRVDHLGNNR